MGRSRGNRQVGRFFAVALILCIAGPGAGVARAQSELVVKIDDRVSGPAIPDDFAGLSFETSNLLPDKNGTYLFSGSNKDLIQLFRTIGIKNLRVGGGTADGPEYRVPGPADIDQLFAFAKAADVRVIYTLRLLNGSIADDANIASYIEQHYASQLVCFQIGNEPDWHSFHTSEGHKRDPRIVEAVSEVPGTAYPSFLADWKDFASAINTRAPAAKYTGPDTGSNYPVPGTKDTDFEGKSWTEHFALDEKASGRLLFVAHHDYAGENGAGVSVPTAVESMLSKDWVTIRYPLLFEHVLEPVLKQGLSYRMTEANDYTGGVDGASNAFASALWALDYLHWHAEHHAMGINFHNKRWIYTDTIYMDPSGALRFNPKAYAFKAFDIGSRGSPALLSITNQNEVNLTAYAVRDEENLYVTVINKEYGPKARWAAVTIAAPGISGRAAGMFLKSSDGDVTAKTGITFGEAPITMDSWNGKWTELDSCKNGRTTVRVPAASAVVLKLALR